MYDQFVTRHNHVWFLFTHRNDRKNNELSSSLLIISDISAFYTSLLLLRNNAIVQSYYSLLSDYHSIMMSVAITFEIFFCFE